MTLVQSEPKAIKIGTTDVKAVYLGENKVRPSGPTYETESIVYKMNADYNGRLYVPVGGYNINGGWATYNWKVSVDGGVEHTYSGTGSNGGAIALSGYTAGSEHTITIKPATEAYQWARAYGWRATAGATYLTEVLYDGSFMGYATGATATGNFFRAIQYSGCTGLKASPEEVLPDTVTSIGNYFRYQQYYQCTALEEISGWKDLSIGGTYYRYQQYYQCTKNKTVTVLSNVGYASYDANVLQNRYITSVNVPSTYLTNFKNSNVQPRSSITDSKFVGY